MSVKQNRAEPEPQPTPPLRSVDLSCHHTITGQEMHGNMFLRICVPEEDNGHHVLRVQMMKDGMSVGDVRFVRLHDLEAGVRLVREAYNKACS